MKKTMILAAFAALVSLASCQKEDNIINGTDKKASPVFTASIAGATKTTVDLTDGKVAWEETDEITITDASLASAVYKIESIDGTTGEATFIIKDGETALGSGPYTATYGTEPSTSQIYSATAGKLYMTAESSTNSFTFDVQCGLMKLNLTKTGESVKRIAVTSSANVTYTLTCDPVESIASAKDFCIALPAGSYTKIAIANADDNICTLNSVSGVTVAANYIKPVTLTASKLNFIPTKGSAKATINEVETDVNWVQLWKNGPKFAVFNVGVTDGRVESFGGHYCWGRSIDRENPGTCNTGSVALTGADDTATALWGSRWRMPTKADFDNLCANCDVEWTTVGGVNGRIFTGKGAYASNSIFLPATAACNDGTVLTDNFYGNYWSSTPENNSRAWYLHSRSTYTSVSPYDRTRGFSIRAVLAE